MKTTKKTLKKYQTRGEVLDGSKVSEDVKKGIGILKSGKEVVNGKSQLEELQKIMGRNKKAVGDSIIKFQRATIVNPKPKQKKGGSTKR